MTTTITTRAAKGSALSWAEADANFENLKATADGVEGAVTGIYNAKSAAYGAFGNGVTDDTAAIQACLTAAGSAGGGVVYVPAGTYKVANTLVIPSYVQIRGAGRGATILRGIAGPYPGVSVDGQNVYATLAMVRATAASVRSLTVDHATNLCQANGIVAIRGYSSGTPSVNCVIEDCEVIAALNQSYLIWNYKSTGTRIVGNYLNGNITTDTPASQQEGIEIYGGSNVVVAGNTLKNIGNGGIFLWSDTDTGILSNVKVVHNTIDTAQICVRLAADECQSILIDGNYINGGWKYGIEASADEGYDDARIVNNSIESSDVGIYVWCNSGKQTKRLVISGNAIKGSLSADDGSIHMLRAVNAVVANNVIEDSAGVGIYFAVSCSDAVCSGNVVKSPASHGIRADDSSRIIVHGNRVRDYNAGGAGGYGIYLAACTYCHVDGNGFTAGVLAYPVYCSGGSRNAVGPGNHIMGPMNTSPWWRNTGGGVDFNRGSVSLTAGSTSISVTNNAVHYSNTLVIYQTAGAPKPIAVNQFSGGFDLAFSSAVGDEVYTYMVFS